MNDTIRESLGLPRKPEETWKRLNPDQLRALGLPENYYETEMGKRILETNGEEDA